MSYQNTALTNNGRRALAAALLGEQITYTKIIMGAGYIPEGFTAETMETMSEAIEQLDIVKLATGTSAGTAIVGGLFTNDGRENGFYFRELGLYATTPTTGEVLYSYTNAGDLAEWIPESGGHKLVEKHIDCVTIIDNATHVSALLASGVYASLEQVNNASEIAEDAKRIADEAAEKADRVSEIIDGLGFVGGKCKWIIELEARIKRLEDALFKDIAANSFAVTFDTLAGKTVESGNWNETAARLEC